MSELTSQTIVLKSNDRYHDEWLIKSWLNQKSDNTKRAYSRIADDFLAWIHPRGLKRITLFDVQTFTDNKSRKKSTASLKIAALKSLLTHAQRSGYLEANLGAFIKGIKTDSKLTERYLTVDEVKKMLSITTEPRDFAILKMLYSGGLRVSELVQLNWGDLQARDNGESQFKILGKGDKSRVVMVSKSTTEAIMALKLNQKIHDPIFESQYGTSARLTDRAVRLIVLKAAQRAGISKNVSPHWLRHAHASHALDQGAPIHLVQATLGHSSVATTGRYLHARPSESSGKYLGE